MQAVILAAGIGRRLGEITKEIPKCMIEVNGKTLIESSITNLYRAGIKRIIMVVGHGKEKLINHVKEKFSDKIDFVFIENKDYRETNNIYSLYLARDLLTEDNTVLLESDLIYDFSIIDRLLRDEREVLAVVDKYKSWMDGTVVKVDEEDNITAFIPKEFFDYKEIDEYYKTVNIYKFSKEFMKEVYLPFLKAYIEVFGKKEYYELVLRVISALERANIKALKLNGERWYEIDTVQDIKNAECIFSDTPEIKLNNIKERYGGYWRFPYLKDFCYLVNPYFPPPKMIEEIKTYFHDLLCQYPSGQKTQNLLASLMFNVEEDYITVGNGASELIKALASNIKGKTGIIFPTFDEYPARFKDVEAFFPVREDLSYGIEELEHILKKCEILLLINPDNPRGNYIPLNDVLNLLDIAKDKDKTVIIDESFIDFSREGERGSLLKNEILERFPNLVVVKSIGKTYGIPGLRLGVIATADRNITEKVRKDLPIWNINSFAEFFLQIINKYKDSYKEACEKIKKEREWLYKELSSISFLRVLPSEANYFMCEVKDKFSSKELVLKLFERNILIKDLSGKKGIKGDFVRIAIRGRKDNKMLIDALRELDND